MAQEQVVESIESICGEIDEPVITDYEFFTESHGVKIYRQYNETSGLYTYKVYGVLEEVSPDTCAQVYLDIEYRKKWDNYVKDLYEVTEGSQKAIYWRVAYPFPLSHRDYVYSRDYQKVTVSEVEYHAVIAQSICLPSVKEKSGVIRVTDYLQQCVLTGDGKSGTKAFMKYYDDPGGMIPTWLINWAAKSGVPGFLKDMQKACRGYPQYLEKKMAAAGT